MKKIIINFSIILSSFVWTIFITGYVYWTLWPATPTWEFIRWWLSYFLEKSLVVSWTWTDWIVKKSLDTDNLWSWTMISFSWNIWILTNSPQANLDISGGIKTNSFNLNWGNSNQILISDWNWNWVWWANNYKLKVQSLMINWWTYWQNCFVMEDTSLKCVWYNWNWRIWMWTNTNNYYFPQKIPISWVKKVIWNNLNTYTLMLNWDVYFIWWYNRYWEWWLWDTTTRYIPQKINWISNATDIVTSWRYYTDWTTWRWAAHACALINDWTIKCWGRNWTWQLWTWDTTNRLTPTQVFWVSWATKIVMTDWQLRWNTCALINDWTVKCWWRNWWGTLWNWDNNWRLYATTVNITNVNDIVMWWTNQSWAHACALINDWTVKCWWYNWHGEIWNWNTNDQWNPTLVNWLNNVKKIIITWWSAYDNYAITNDNKVYSWGENSRWQLWVWDTTNRSSPTLINWLNNVSDIVSTWWNAVTTCALINDWTVKCWGYNWNWQLWVWDTTNRSSPTQVLWISWISSIKVYTTYWSNRPFTCALVNDWTVKCWWYNWFWQLWQNNTFDYYIPVVVKNLNHD